MDCGFDPHLPYSLTHNKGKVKLILITVTYPANAEGSKAIHSKTYKYEHMPSDRVSEYLEKSMGDGRITRVVVKNGDSIVWDSNRDEDWF